MSSPFDEDPVDVTNSNGEQQPQFTNDSDDESSSQPVQQQSQVSCDDDSKSSEGSAQAVAPVETKKESKITKITVGEPELRGSAFSKHHEYKVTTVPSLVEFVYRRYSDFVWLRAALTKCFPGVFIPPLPPKKLFGNKEENLVSERRQDLERFLNRIGKIDYMSESEPFQRFLYRNQVLEDCVKDLNKQLDTRETREIVQVYQQVFPHVNAIPISDTADKEIADLKDFLSSCYKKLETLNENANNLCDSFVTYINQLEKFNNSHNSLLQIENQFGHKGMQRTSTTEGLSSWHRFSLHLHPAHENFKTLMKYEIQDVESYLEAIKLRDEVRSKWEKAKKEAQKWSSKAPANDKQETQKTADLQREKEESDLSHILTKLLLHSELKDFWENKVKEFHKIMYEITLQSSRSYKQLSENFETLANQLATSPQ